MSAQRLKSLFFAAQWLLPAAAYAAAIEAAPPAQASEAPPPSVIEDERAKEPGNPLKGGPFLNELEGHEERILLKGLNSLCADAWCEGSLNVHFSGFKCSFKPQELCLMSYRIWDQTSGNAGINSFSFICAMGVKAKKQLFGNPSELWISDSLFSAVSECIQEGEKRMGRKRNAP